MAAQTFERPKELIQASAECLRALEAATAKGDEDGAKAAWKDLRECLDANKQWPADNLHALSMIATDYSCWTRRVKDSAENPDKEFNVFKELANYYEGAERSPKDADWDWFVVWDRDFCHRECGAYIKLKQQRMQNAEELKCPHR